MATEQFLINPPKRKPSRKHKKSMVGMKKHRILAFGSKAGGLFTSPEAKIVRKGIKLNPFRFRSNPLGEELMFVGLNPKKGGHSMAHKKRSKKRHYKKNPARKHRRYHRNPMSSMKSLVPMVVAGGAGALVGRAVPQFIPVLNGMGTLGNIISKAGLAFGVAYAIDKSGLGKKFPGIEDGWLVGSLASAVADLSSVGIVKTMQGLGMLEPAMVTDYNGGMGAYVLNGTDDNPYADNEGTFEETY